MAKISHASVEEVNSRIDIVSLIGEYTRLEKRGSEYWGCCPFHNEKTPSFHVVPERKMYHCFGCKAGGSVINFYMEMEKVSFYEAVVTLAKKAGVEIIFEGNVEYQEAPENSQRDLYKELYTRVAGSYNYILNHTPQGKIAKDYLEKRGLSSETIEMFSLGYSPNDGLWLRKFLESKKYSKEFLDNSGLFSKKNPDYSFFRNRLMFPIWDRNGKVVAFSARLLEGEGPKYVNSPELVTYKKGETLYAFHLAKKSIREKKACILCEGNMDVIAYHSAGITNAVAPMGTALTEEQLHLIGSFADTLILSLDTDEAGQKATWKDILMARKKGLTVKIIQLQGGKDPDEVLQKFGKETLTNCVNTAILDSDFLLSSLSKKYDLTTPEGKTKAALEFFQYVDVLQSDIQKESSLEQLANTLQVSLETVKSDYVNRESATKKLENRTTTEKKTAQITLNAELRAVLAVVSNIDFFPLMRGSLSADDFEDPLAKDMFITLEECYREDIVNYDSILHKLHNENLRNIVAQAVTSGEFSQNTEKTINDSIKLIRFNSLKKRRDSVMTSIRQISTLPKNLDNQQKLDALLNEKMNIDNELKFIKDTSR